MIETVMKYWPLIVVTGSLISTWVAWSAKKHFVTHDALAASRAAMDSRIGGVADKVTCLERDVALVKAQLETLPTKDDLHRIEVAVSAVAGDVKAVSVGQAGLVRNVHLLMKDQIGGE